MNLLRKTIRPEFLNRIDELIMFRPLSEAEIEDVTTLQLKNLKHMLAVNGITLSYTPAAVQFISALGFDPQYGARPVKRVIQREVLNVLSKKILSGEISRDAAVTLDSDGERAIFRNE